MDFSHWAVIMKRAVYTLVDDVEQKPCIDLTLLSNREIANYSAKKRQIHSHISIEVFFPCVRAKEEPWASLIDVATRQIGIGSPLSGTIESELLF